MTLNYKTLKMPQTTQDHLDYADQYHQSDPDLLDRDDVRDAVFSIQNIALQTRTKGRLSKELNQYLDQFESDLPRLKS